MDITDLNERYDRLWTKAERLVEAFLDQQLAMLEAAVAPLPAMEPNSAGAAAVRSRRAKTHSAAHARKASKEHTATTSAPLSATAAQLVPAAPAAAAMREIYIAVQCLKRIHEGRQAVLTGGNHDVQSLGPTDAAKTVAEEISRRIRALSEPNHSNGNDEGSV